MASVTIQEWQDVPEGYNISVFLQMLSVKSRVPGKRPQGHIESGDGQQREGGRPVLESRSLTHVDLNSSDFMCVMLASARHQCSGKF